MGRVSLGITHDELIHALFMNCVLKLKNSRDLGPTIMVLGGPGNLDVGRNKVAAYFLDNTDSEWLLTIDTDMVFTPEHFDTLLATGMEHKAVSGIYFVNEAAPRPCMVIRDDASGAMLTPKDWEEGIVPVHGVGGGFMLIHRDALLAIGDTSDTDRGGPWYRQSATGANQSMLEPDYALCQRLEQTGNQVVVNTKVFVGHIKSRVLGMEL